MARKIRITVDGVVGEVVLNEAGAPKTSAHLWESLPIEGELRHLRWGGEGAYVLVDALAVSTLEVEDGVTFYPPGSIALRPVHGEFVLAYGQAQARSHQVAAAYATLLGRLTPQSMGLLDQARDTRSEGAKPILIERVGE